MLKGCDLVIEAVFEQRARSRSAGDREAEPLLAEGGLASEHLDAADQRLAEGAAPRRAFHRLHFFSPVDKMELVEIIRRPGLAEGPSARAYDYMLQIGKTPIVVNDLRGFFTSRVRHLRDEGAAMLEEGIVAPLVEHAAEAAGMPVGPLAVLDETSLSPRCT